MKKSLLIRGAHVARSLAALLMIAGVLAAGPRAVAAQDDDSGVEGNTYTSPNYGWSVEWDEDAWAFEADTEDNANGSDFFQMTTVEEPFAYATFFAGVGYSGDPDDCAVGYEDTLSELNGTSDVAETDEFELPEAPDDGAAATFTYTSEVDSGDLELIDYVLCLTVVEDEAVLMVSVTTTPNVFEDLIPVIEDLMAGIALPDDAGRSSQDDEDEDVTPEADDEDVTPESDDEDVTPEADDAEEETPESDEEDAEPTRDVLLGDDEDETPAADDEDEPVGDTGIDENSYTSPTYGFTVEWDEDFWVAEPEDELVDDGSVGLDRLLLLHEDEDGFYASFYVEGKTDYEGDTADCLTGEAELLESEQAVVDFAPLEDRSGDPVEGEADSGGEFAAFVATIETEAGDEVELIEHVECQTLEDGESVVVFTLITSEDIYEDELDAALEVIDTLELDNGGASDDADDEETSRSSADDEDTADGDATVDDEPAADDEPTEEPADDDESARAPVASGFAV